MPENGYDNPYASPSELPSEAKAEDRQAISPNSILAASTIFGFAVGAISSYVRPMIPGPIHYEAIASLLLISLFLLIAIFTCLRTARPVQWMSLVILLTWLSHFAGWSLVAWRVWADFFAVTAVSIGCSLAIALPLLFFWSRKRLHKEAIDVDSMQ